MTSEAAIDRIVEAARADDVEREHGVADAYQPTASMVYDAKTWHMDCADFMCADTVAGNDEIREALRGALRNLDNLDHLSTVDMQMMCMRLVSDYASKIGFLVIANAIKNGLTYETAGDYSDVK